MVCSHQLSRGFQAFSINGDGPRACAHGKYTVNDSATERETGRPSLKWQEERWAAGSPFLMAYTVPLDGCANCRHVTDGQRERERWVEETVWEIEIRSVARRRITLRIARRFLLLFFYHFLLVCFSVSFLNSLRTGWTHWPGESSDDA